MLHRTAEDTERSCHYSHVSHSNVCSDREIPSTVPRWGTVVAEVKVPSVEKPGFSKVLLLKPGGGQNVSMHALPTARNFFLFDFYLPGTLTCINLIHFLLCVRYG